jgi:putative copper export protein
MKDFSSIIGLFTVNEGRQSYTTIYGNVLIVIFVLFMGYLTKLSLLPSGGNERTLS